MINRTLRLGLAMVVLALTMIPASVRAVTVTYFNQGTFTTASPLTIDGLTATAGAGQTLSLTNGAGLGVVGGAVILGDLIDGTESVLFEFDAGPATGIGFSSSVGTIGSGGNPNLNLEGFDAGGASLGVVTFNAVLSVGVSPTVDVSALFGGIPLSAFEIAGNGTSAGILLRLVSFEPAVVSEPSTLVSAGIAGLIGLGVVSRRRKRLAA